MPWIQLPTSSAGKTAPLPLPARGSAGTSIGRDTVKLLCMKARGEGRRTVTHRTGSLSSIGISKRESFDPKQILQCNLHGCTLSLMSGVVLVSALRCPECGHVESLTMPTDSCVFFHECNACGALLKPLDGDCCVFCSYGTVPCPPRQGGDGGDCCGRSSLRGDT